ncbi:FUSC family protein [Ancylobacter sp. 6x-1]|uniref:FUSC family protein n=1 Tax=Ancylobacter crimeensis TaxID=2579147 RepID=A0ABT0DFL0_9HYPH|nr:FUSC family protein [Ancylobacter crimeensis]MCK0198743.1 FUSC family protein [Ancylobacter crimeensis]
MSETGPPSPPEPDGGRSPRRRDAVRHLLHPDQLRDSLSLSAQPSLRNATLAGLQAALTAAIALPLVHLSPWSHLVGFAALGALVALFGRFAPSRRRLRILLLSGLCQVLAVFGMSTAAWLGAPMAAQLLLLALACGLFLFISVTGRFGAPGPLIFVFAAGASMSGGLEFGKVVERTAATAIVAVLAWIVCLASEAFRHLPSPERPLPADPVPALGPRLVAAARSAVGAGIAIFAGHAIGANHPAWAAMGALAVMQGTHLHITMNRALQRMAGTMVGAVLAWALLMQHPSVWTVIAVIVVLQLLTEMVIGINYAFGQFFVTPMALLMTYLGAAGAVGPEMAPERVLDTLLGAAVGILMAVLFSTLDDRRHLAGRRPAT